MRALLPTFSRRGVLRFSGHHPPRGSGTRTALVGVEIVGQAHGLELFDALAQGAPEHVGEHQSQRHHRRQRVTRQTHMHHPRMFHEKRGVTGTHVEFGEQDATGLGVGPG